MWTWYKASGQDQTNTSIWGSQGTIKVIQASQLETDVKHSVHQLMSKKHDWETRLVALHVGGGRQMIKVAEAEPGDDWGRAASRPLR